MSPKFWGPFLVGLAAMLWATDSLFRFPLVQAQVDPLFIVFADHLICAAALTPWVLSRHRAEMKKIKGPQWLALAVLGGGASAIALLLFTASFKYVNPSVTILLQKLQPVFVVLLAMIFLGERPGKGFYFWGPVALAAGLALSFPDLNFSFASGLDVGSRGAIYALSAAGIWAAATVLGKGILRSLAPSIVTYWRYIFGLLTILILMVIDGGSITASWRALDDTSVRNALLYIAFIPGLTAMVLYYQGMVRTPASTTTFMELLFPVSAVVINTAFLNQPLAPAQAAAALVLLFAVAGLSRSNAN